MKVRDLIELLEKFDSESELRFKSCIESGRSFSFCNDGHMDLEVFDNKVEISIFGDEDYCE